ncbi:MAG: tRNA (guanosine(46)-N7)-methyltransferase TrmB [Alphaproteobacteria bacterium]|nr:tRNA (guanosine(46)-N7)-methyltransferase TrmB [Alphaproteobacteria bacterium]
MKEDYPLIRSFGRIITKPLSTKKKEDLETILPKLSIPDSIPHDLTKIFHTPVKNVCLDIGFGGGENLIEKVLKNPEIGYIGSEVFLDGMIKFLRFWENSNCPQNCLVSTDDVRTILQKIQKESLDQIDLFYPDPWHKARHHKRRMIAEDNLKLLEQTLKTTGILRVVSDISNYIDMAKETIAQNPKLKIISCSTTPFEDWTTTRYEQKAFREGRIPQYLIAVKR